LHGGRSHRQRRGKHHRWGGFGFGGLGWRSGPSGCGGRCDHWSGRSRRGGLAGPAGPAGFFKIGDPAHQPLLAVEGQRLQLTQSLDFRDEFPAASAGVACDTQGDEGQGENAQCQE
jgi:hypothetical protein